MAKKYKRNSEEISFNDAIRALSSWYNQEVREWADEFDKRIKEGEFKDSEDFTERFDEETDSAQLVIYTMQAKACLLVSKNDEAYEESFGEGEPGTVEARALMAFRADIMEHMESDVNDDDTFEADDDEDEDD
jgi:hypothetical protein